MTEEEIASENAYKKALAREHAVEDNKTNSTKQVDQVWGPAQKRNPAETGSRSSTKHGWGKKGNSYPRTSSSSGSGNTKGSMCEQCKLPTRVNKCKSSQCKTKCFNCDSVGHTRKTCRKPSKIHKEDEIRPESDYFESINYIEIDNC